MKRDELIHVVRASADVTGEREFIVVGSQAILASVDNPPSEMVFSVEADIYPKRSPDRAIEVDGAIGEGSSFDVAFGYYAHGVGPETAKCPSGWEDRLVSIDFEDRQGNRIVAECLEPHDLVLSKCAAGRERDWEFAEAAIRAGLVESATLKERIRDMPLSEDRKASVRRMVDGVAERARRRT